MRKKVLFYTPFLKVGGIEKVTVEYLKLLDESGLDVELLIDYDMGKDNLLLKYIPDHIKCTFVKCQFISKFIYSLRTLSKRHKILLPFLFFSVLVSDVLFYKFKVKKKILLSDFDLTITFYQFLPSYLLEHSRGRNVIWLHGSIEHFFGGFKNLFIKKYLKKINRYDKVVTIAEEMREQLLNFYPELDRSKVMRIYNPIDFDIINALSFDKSTLNDTENKIISRPYMCHVSRVDENQKDITSLLKAYASLVSNSVVSHNLVIVGSGPDVTKLKNLSHNLNISQYVFFVGNQLNPYVWMRNSDIVVLSSKFEGFGLVIVEAMSVGTFVIASACKTGPREIIGENEFGDLFDVGNVNQLAGLLGFALSDSTYRNLKISLAKDRVREFSRDESLVQVLSLIDDSIEY